MLYEETPEVEFLATMLEMPRFKFCLMKRKALQYSDCRFSVLMVEMKLADKAATTRRRPDKKLQQFSTKSVYLSNTRTHVGAIDGHQSRLAPPTPPSQSIERDDETTPR